MFHIKASRPLNLLILVYFSNYPQSRSFVFCKVIKQKVCLYFFNVFLSHKIYTVLVLISSLEQSLNHELEKNVLLV